MVFALIPLAIKFFGKLSISRPTVCQDQYDRHGLEFVANSASTLSRFTGTTPSGNHIGLDNVVVTNVPEAASWLLACLAFCWFGRQRSSHCDSHAS
jgi:hypothetical protein